MFLVILITWCNLHTGMTFYTECGQTHFTSSTGTIQSPNYPSDYPPDTACIWTIAVETGGFVHLTFTNYYTQGCCDALTVYDGPSIGSLRMA
ncbi:Tolloid-like protein 2 [Mizuhopecten yessoensis]|uniref:Tolloid-like protein 2 n=1 Tax=Mizuhopecten yessoensis TaxID=6573 RepID=A0A210PHQ5_MIZYE|nr:Tolloid-like protein 2 [Mizuhopecten yessoensis]